MAGLFDPYLYGRMRQNLPPTDPMQRILAPLEHREAAREIVGRNPLMAAPYAVAPLAYYLAKLLGQPLGFYQDATPPSLDQILGGYEGLFSGLQDYTQR